MIPAFEVSWLRRLPLEPGNPGLESRRCVFESRQVPSVALVMRSTRAQRRFKRLAGNVNHFLITIMVGLDAVRDGKAQLPPAYSTSWAPHNVIRSADRSGEFANKALVAWLIDALDAYARELNRKPFLLQDEGTRRELDSLPSSVQARVDWIGQHFDLADEVAYGLSVVAITWRNRMVHSDAENEVPREIGELLEANVESIRDQYQGLEVRRALDSLERGRTPSLKEVTALVRAAHAFVGEADERIREQLDLELYFEEALQRYVGEDKVARIANVWGKGEATCLKSLRQIAMQAGLSPGDALPALSDDVLERAAGLSEIEARELYAGSSDPSSTGRAEQA
jgi:hypothetical protein